MIRKFESIKNFGVFKDFRWDRNVVNKQGEILNLKEINIIYGRNYSGKTTLSRILQILEYKQLPSNIENPEFNIILSDGSKITNDNFSDFPYFVRAFNEDFVRKYLGFIIDPDKDIEPFAVLGENVELEKEIRKLENILGEREPYPTGLYKELIEKESFNQRGKKDYDNAEDDLKKQLQKKAIDKNIGIKYHANKFGDQNYNIGKLKKDIKSVLENPNLIISEEQKQEFEKLIEEKAKEEIPPLSSVDINFNDLKNKVRQLVEQKVIKTEKIEQLVKDAMLNKWVKDGKDLHQEKGLNVCAFCGNPISDERWKELDKHFDEESKKLEEEISEVIDGIDSLITRIKNGFNVNKDLFYSKYHKKLDELISKYSEVSGDVIEDLNKLKKQLENRKIDIINEKIFQEVLDRTYLLSKIFDEYEEVRNNANQFTNELENKQKEAKEKLRLKEVYDFIKTISYEHKISNIKELKKSYEKAKQEYQDIDNQIKGIIQEIENKKKLLRNEGVAAKKINEYLNNHFGHKYLSLKPIEENDEITNNEQVKFKVFRGNSIAYNLSEGEKTLIAFCYFIAKLDDIETHSVKPIIWIDDPVSSLDQNHIYFIYSLIQSAIINKKKFEQLFITTHNLQFLKYLKRMTGKKENGKDYDKFYLIVERLNNHSVLKHMPKYLKEYITEFNYLFHQIYICANQDVNDSNYNVFYNFGNNARKFLEIFLFYRYPDFSEYHEKMKKFFGEDISVILLNRLDNENSHLRGTLERGEQPIGNVEEIKKTALLILNKIKELDEEQYNSFLESIGVKSNE